MAVASVLRSSSPSTLDWCRSPPSTPTLMSLQWPAARQPRSTWCVRHSWSPIRWKWSARSSGPFYALARSNCTGLMRTPVADGGSCKP
ncbi:hypothetical protein ACFFX0_32250 [Citricoccus parietis]|uniref:Uncharacterized protein n=1 Tax=Citricoccus parietis TaxID=592307 RepID=A0ABV5G9H2_9MICC